MGISLPTRKKQSNRFGFSMELLNRKSIAVFVVLCGQLGDLNGSLEL